MEQHYIVAVDMGGTRFRVALATPSGEISRRESHATKAAEGRDAVISRIIAATEKAIRSAPKDSVLAVGFGAPGPLDPRTGVVFTPPNLPDWRDVPLKA